MGDSILEGLSNLQYSFGPNTIYDTEVARSALLLQTVMDEHDVPQTLVVHLGTNGWWPNLGDDYSTVFAALTDRSIVLVNISVDRPYTAAGNTELQAVADALDHVTLVDWNGAATGALLRDDGFHPNVEGYSVLANLIGDAVGIPATAPVQPQPEQTPGPQPSANIG